MPDNMMNRNFWAEACTLKATVTMAVLPRVLAFGAYAAAISLLDSLIPHGSFSLDVGIGPHEVAGGVLGLLLVLRTGAGQDRWWEARKLWGEITNASRILAVDALAYGPDDARWRDRFVRLLAAYPHAIRASLRGEGAPPEVAALVGPEAAARVAGAEHMPSGVSLMLCDLLREAVDRHGMDRFFFLQLDVQRARFLDLAGGCERILKTPLPQITAIIIRRFILFFVASLPFALITKIGNPLTPLVTMLVAYPILSLDQAGVDLQAPFSPRSLSHLPLNQICRTIEGNLLALLEGRSGDPGPEAGAGTGPDGLTSAVDRMRV